jgi:hypothetical protein
MSQAGHERTVYYDTSRIVIDLTVDVHNTFGSSVHAHSLTGTDYHSVIDLTSDIDSSDESEGATCIFYDSTRTADSNFNCRSVRAEHELVIGKCKLKVQGCFSFCCNCALNLSIEIYKSKSIDAEGQGQQQGSKQTSFCEKGFRLTQLSRFSSKK